MTSSAVELLACRHRPRPSRTPRDSAGAYSLGVDSSDWPIIVDWSEAHLARHRLDAWLGANGLTKQGIENQLRCDISRSLDGIQEFRYCVAPEVLALVDARPSDIGER